MQLTYCSSNFKQARSNAGSDAQCNRKCRKIVMLEYRYIVISVEISKYRLSQYRSIVIANRNTVNRVSSIVRRIKNVTASLQQHQMQTLTPKATTFVHPRRLAGCVRGWLGPATQRDSLAHPRRLVLRRVRYARAGRQGPSCTGCQQVSCAS